MRDRPHGKVERGRLLRGGPVGALYGAFRVMGPCGAELMIVSSDADGGTGWEHVSVSTERRIPNWLEMSTVKEWFWRDDECVVQFHPPAEQYVNNHPRCLHLWRNVLIDFPMPPQILVGVKSLGVLQHG